MVDSSQDIFKFFNKIEFKIVIFYFQIEIFYSQNILNDLNIFGSKSIEIFITC